MTPEQLAAARKTLGLTRGELAAKLEVSERAVQAYELGTRGIPGPVRVLVRQMLQEHEQHRPQPPPRKRAAR